MLLQIEKGVDFTDRENPGLEDALINVGFDVKKNQKGDLIFKATPDDLLHITEILEVNHYD